MSGYLLDTNVISEFVKPKPAALVVEWLRNTDEELLYLSALTIGEIRGGIERLASGRKRSKLESWLASELLSRFSGRILPVDSAVAEIWGRITASAAEKGRPLPVIDGLLAATALRHSLTLVTRDSVDVAGAGVPVFDPWAE